MAYDAKILADSISQGVRLTSMQVTYPRFIHAECMTHRVFSRSSASSRAIPITKMIERVEQDPVVPIWWGKNQAGMQAATELSSVLKAAAANQWLQARDQAVVQARRMQELGVHKQLVNRIIEPWMWITVIVTATEWENFFALRISPEAQPEFRRIAELMRDAMNDSAPRELGVGEWHLPFIDEDDKIAVRAVVPDEDVAMYLARISAARCARVSYLTHDGRRDHQEDLNLAQRLSSAGHMSPFEHVALASIAELWGSSDFIQHGEYFKLPNFIGNFRAPWMQYRKMLPNEAVFKRGD